MLPGLVLFLNMRTIALNLLPVRFSEASGYSWRSCVPAARSWRCSFFLRTIRLLEPLQSEALVERFAVQLKEDLELVTSFAQNTQSYHHLRRTCLGLRVTRGSLGSRVAQSGAVWQFSPSGPENVVLGGFSTRLALSYPWWWSLGLSSICSPTLLSVCLLPSMYWYFTVLKSSRAATHPENDPHRLGLWCSSLWDQPHHWFQQFIVGLLIQQTQFLLLGGGDWPWSGQEDVFPLDLELQSYVGTQHLCSSSHLLRRRKVSLLLLWG